MTELLTQTAGLALILAGVFLAWKYRRAPLLDEHEYPDTEFEKDEYTISDSEWDRLRTIHLRAIQLNEELEHLAAESCRLNHVDPESEGIERDWCDEIVFHRTPPAVTANRLARRRRANHAN